MIDRPASTSYHASPMLLPAAVPPTSGSSDLASRIERALLLLAYFIELDGDVHLPMYEKFEAELDELRRLQATRQRARERLNRFPFSERGGLRAIR